MTTDLNNPGRAGAWTATGTATTGQPRQGGRHRWDKGGPVTNGRKQITNPVTPAYNPLHSSVRVGLAPHHWADPDRHLPAPEQELTGRMDTKVVLAHGQPPTEQPADRDQVLAEMRGDLGDPAAVVAEIFTAAGCPDLTGADR
ncbi:hypothetical protein [Micromonospora sp. NPDC048839]|uniref:hypothetical protein n=1 Tax=Micromonospora sp. NPDC048839 TaxID=3155641 RepID=UPI0033DCFA75